MKGLLYKDSSLNISRFLQRYGYFFGLHHAHASILRRVVFLLVAACLLQSSVVIAANESIPSDRKITSLKVYSADVLVYFSPDFDNTQNCSSSSVRTIQLKLSQDPDKTMFNSIIAAAKTGSPIGFGIGGCNGGYPRIYRVDTPFN